MLIGAILLQAAAPAPAAIVVEGRRYEDELAACVERACPPGEEMELSLQASVQQFQDGRYEHATANLRRTISRNRRHAAQEPALLSSLHSTLGTVTRHTGDLELNRRAVYAALQVLREHLPDRTVNILQAELDVADMQIAGGDAIRANRSLESVVRTAAAHGHGKLAALITLRQAGLAASRGALARTRRLVAEAVELGGGTERIVYEVGQILIHRAEAARGDAGAIDRLAASVRQQQGVAPILVQQRSLISYQRELFVNEPDVGLRPIWADVGFWVRPDGRTAEVDVLRSATRQTGWLDPVLRQIEGRRYLPRTLDPGDPGSYRIERVTLRSVQRVPTGSRIRRPSGMPQFEIVDLTHLSDEDEAQDNPFGPGTPPAQNPDSNADASAPGASTA